MNPLLKYSLARLGLFVAVLLPLLLLPIDILLKLMIAVLVSAVLSFFVLRRGRDEVAVWMAGAAERRRAEKARLQSALSGADSEEAGPQ